MNAPRQDTPFQTYEKIAESPRKWRLDEADTRRLEKTPWVVTEKIHGANFSFLTNGEQVHFAKRKELLAPDDDFFDYEEIALQLYDSLLELFALLKSTTDSLEWLTLVGELFGGCYPHPDVPATPSVSPIQTGVYYCPQISFQAFDLALHLKNNPKRQYLGWQAFQNALLQTEIPFTQALFVGKMSDAFAYPLGFDSTLPAQFGLPPLPFANKAEGIVFKPAEPILVQTTKGPLRPVLKLKIPEFAEDQRYHQATAWSSKTTTTHSDEHLLLQTLTAFATPTRLHNALSKTGRPATHDPQKIASLFELFVEDLWESFEETHPTALSQLDEETQRWLRAQAEELAKTLMRSELSLSPL